MSGLGSFFSIQLVSLLPLPAPAGQPVPVVGRGRAISANSGRYFSIIRHSLPAPSQLPPRLPRVRTANCLRQPARPNKLYSQSQSHDIVYHGTQRNKFLRIFIPRYVKRVKKAWMVYLMSTLR